MPTRHIVVSPERMERWLVGFTERHGPVTHGATPDAVTIHAADGAQAQCQVPFGPLDIDADAPYSGLLAHVRRTRRVGVLLVRRGGHAAGIFDGSTLVESKVGSRHVQGRTAAGGQSQQRFARRREKQAREAFAAAADIAARIILPHVRDLDAMVCGGDRTATRQVLSDPRLTPLNELVVSPHIDVPDPKLAVLRRTPDMFRAVRISLTEPD
ncbi:acVLRF1 family peptidyl-tRNA hydrolase [Phytoactinopolyspora limicola]|uniref:acVLRF1 family peptidyl-tRNA hydrolase n=1 Tax=Phytoactinopolyspora limicola TaxID=2715536 RepID=UPI00140A027D|nr:acVLRF1 family peptidyl-tRNA hydrolase [Phytoactinopolyspora limicola]